jgi:hypothetical protein
MSKALIRCAVTVALLTAGTFAWATPAGADVVVPKGACHGEGKWQKAGLNEASADHVPSDVIKVPRKDTVAWTGGIGTAEPGATIADRPIKGSVQIQLPPPVGWVTIDDWGKHTTAAANSGTHSYDFPNVLVGVKMKLQGSHYDNGNLTCKGSVFVQIEGGSNPLKMAGLIGMILFGLLLLYSGRPKFTKDTLTYTETH